MLIRSPFPPLHFNMSFYMTYLARWPDYFQVAEGPGKQIMDYIMGKVEGQAESWHGHVTTVTVAPEYRRQRGRCVSYAEFDMRKALSRDVKKKSVIPLKQPITPDELEYD
ncbi:hypothetical protein V6N12_066980 [Hibiscus sabdariffa]|uniref:Uncharacterized protein n=1 Tax=Hibiscus sabdariffa TaxID=183260 RepID=A0ABR2AVM1_9ROSI